MKILLTADPELPVPPGLYGGIERLVNMWRRELRARGHLVALCARGDSTAAVDCLYPWPGRTSRGRLDTLRNTLALRRAVREFQPDVVHSSSRLVYALPLLLARRPTVMTYHRLPTPAQVRRGARLGGPALVFTGVSEFIAQLGRQAGGRWHAVPNCVEMGAYEFRPAVPPDAPLVFLSRIEQVKGVREAIAIARRAGRRLILAGNRSADAAADAYWREHVEPAIDGEKVSYVGPVDDAAKNRLLGGAAAMLLPVQWDEPFGMVAVEAMACGTPVIATPRGGLCEIIVDGETGFFAADEAAAVARLAELPRLSRAACRARAERLYSPVAAAERFLAIYEELLAHAGRAAAAP